MSSALIAYAARIVAAAGELAWSHWIGLALVSSITYCAQISTLANPKRDKPCPPYGLVFRVLYGLFGTSVATFVLSRAMHTKQDSPQDEQVGGTQPMTVGQPTMRIKMIPILGAAFGGNYAFLIWDDEDPKKRAIVVDPADPHVVLRAAKAEGLQARRFFFRSATHLPRTARRATRAPRSRRSRCCCARTGTGTTPQATPPARGPCQACRWWRARTSAAARRR